MITLLTSHKNDHLRRQHLQVGWEDLKIELLQDEDAAKVRDIEMLRRCRINVPERVMRGYIVYTAKWLVTSVTLAEHVNVVYVFSFLFSWSFSCY
jgi:hypothetical protein